MAKLIFTESYNRKAKKFFKHHPQIIKQYEKTLKLLEINPFHTSLRLHKLAGKHADINKNDGVLFDYKVDRDSIRNIY